MVLPSLIQSLITTLELTHKNSLAKPIFILLRQAVADLIHSAPTTRQTTHTTTAQPYKHATQKSYAAVLTHSPVAKFAPSFTIRELTPITPCVHSSPPLSPNASSTHSSPRHSPIHSRPLTPAVDAVVESLSLVEDTTAHVTEQVNEHPLTTIDTTPSPSCTTTIISPEVSPSSTSSPSSHLTAPHTHTHASTSSNHINYHSLIPNPHISTPSVSVIESSAQHTVDDDLSTLPLFVWYKPRVNLGTYSAGHWMRSYANTHVCCRHGPVEYQANRRMFREWYRSDPRIVDLYHACGCPPGTHRVFY
jgi:hypothetical protein